MVSRGATNNSGVREYSAEMLRRNTARAIRLAHEGAYSRADQALQSNGVCVYYVAVHQVLVYKHSQKVSVTDGSFSLPSAVELSAIERHVLFKPVEVRDAVDSFSKSIG